ncbi:MAG: hypothetical protein QOJ04_2649, partial [Caballeronia sp.]|nr:hypothetical protein [Caballeronia sp.]
MILRNQRLLWGFAVLALAVGMGAPALATPAETAKPAAVTPDTKAAADKKSAKPKAAPAKAAAIKPATTKSATNKPAQSTAKIASKPIKTNAPLPRARPIVVASAIPMVPPRGSLAPTPILPTTSFSLVSPAAAASAPAPTVYTPASGSTRVAALPAAPLAAAESASTPAADIALVKQALDLARKGKTGEATALQRTIGDPLARK